MINKSILLAVVFVNSVSGMQLTTELAYTRTTGWDYFYERMYIGRDVTLNLILLNEISDHIEIKGQYLLGNLGIGIGFKGDHKYIGYKYTPSLYMNSSLYGDRDGRVSKSIGYGDDAYLRLGHRKYNAYINIPLLTIVTLQLGYWGPWLYQVFTCEYGVRIGLYSIGLTGTFQPWEHSSYWYFFGQIDIGGRRITNLRFGYNPSKEKTCYAVNATFNFKKNSGE